MEEEGWSSDKQLTRSSHSCDVILFMPEAAVSYIWMGDHDRTIEISWTFPVFFFLSSSLFKLFHEDRPALTWVLRWLEPSQPKWTYPFPSRCHGSVRSDHLQHNNTNTAHLSIIREILIIDTTRDRSCAVVVQVEVKLAITGTKLELFEEERIVVKRKSVKDIEFRLYNVRCCELKHSKGIVTFLARISASFINIRSRSLRAFLSPVNAVSVA